MTNQEHVTPFQTFQEGDAVGAMVGSIAAIKNKTQQPIQQDQVQEPIVPQQPPVQQPASTETIQESVANPNAQVAPAVQQSAPAPFTQEPYKAPVIDKIETSKIDDAGQLGGAPVVPEVASEVESPKSDPEEKPSADLEFDQALEELEKELGITVDENGEVSQSDADSKDEKNTEGKKTLAREGKFIKIINELNSTNRNSLKKVGELEVENDIVKSQLDYYKQQAQGYYEELRAQEFDRSKFSVVDKAKNFVHYYNEYDSDKDNSQAKNAAIREAIKLVGNITGRDLTPYLTDYFSRGAATPMGELKGGTGAPHSINISPNKNVDDDTRKRAAIGNTLSNM